MKKQNLWMLAMSVALTMTFNSCTEKENETPTEPADTTSAFNVDGATKHVFSVGEEHTVRFAHGNLQYNAATNTWRLAEKQYDIIGEGNVNVSSTYDGWIDLFCWGTSGWNSGAVYYHPWDTCRDNEGYYVGGSWQNALNGDCAEADWAWHNPIQDGSNMLHLWRTLSYDEWYYLFNRTGEQNVRTGKAGVGTVVGHHGLIILPDDWVLPAGLTFVAGASYDTPSYSVNSYNADEWRKMELAGAVFLPAAGMRGYFSVGANEVTNVGEYGFYWSTTRADDYADGARDLAFDGHGFGYASTRLPRYYGMAVRPVTE